MAVEHIFDTTYYARRGDTSYDAYASNAYRVIIGSTSGTVSASETSELEIYDPGIELSWDGDQDRFTNAIMGSSLSFTTRLDDAQLAKWEEMLDLPEGDVFCLFFDDPSGAPYWYGHLVIEDCSIRVEAEYHRVDITFTDGLASLRGQEWRDEDGDPYKGFKKLSFYLREIINKIPGFTAYKDYQNNYLGEDSVDMIREIALPTAVIVDGDDEYRYQETDYIFDKCRVRADSFNVPKKQVDRIRELEAAQDYLNTGDVLEDICKTFGATACIFDGFLNIGCRHDIATLGGRYVWSGKYSYDDSLDEWTLSSDGYTALTRQTNADTYLEFRAGAVRKRTLPIAQVNLTHEEGGSDFLAAYGYFVYPELSIIDLDSAAWWSNMTGGSGRLPAGSNPDMFSVDGRREDLFLNFRNSADYETGTPAVDMEFYKYPADRTGYLGFEATTVEDLELASGEAIRLNFGGNAKFLQSTPLDSTPDELVGCVLIARFRVQFTTTDDVGYRLSRTVHTHVDTGGSQDYIEIRDGVSGSVSKYFFRKLYNDVEWLKDDHADYDDDGWFEVIIPHGDSDNSGDNFGATLHPLTQEYDGQISYAPIGTTIQGDNDGPGVILVDATEGSGTWHHWFRDVLDFSLPYGDNDATLSFEQFDIEMGFSLFKPQNGPRPNYSGQGGTGNFTQWSNENPTWRSANADGSGAIGTPPSTNLTYSQSPDYIHMTGLRVTQGDGSESSDLVTKITGGDGYEILNMGSSRLGSRVAYSNAHINNVLELKKKDGDGAGDFVTPETFWQKCKWIGHRGAEVAGIPNTKYDSLHAYVADSFLKIFGETVPYYSLSIKPKNVIGITNDYAILKNPFMCFLTDQLRDDKSEKEVLMPMSYSWSMNEGLQGDFLVVGKVRNLSTTLVDYDAARVSRGFGGVIGLPTGVDVIRPVFQSRNVTQNISIDDESGQVTGITVHAGSTVFDADKVSQGAINKFGTAAQFEKVDHLTITSDTDIDTLRADVDANNVKVSFPGFGTTSDTALSGDKQTLEDIDQLPVLTRSDGTEDPVTVVQESPDLLVLAAESKVSGQQGVKKFTVQELFQGIIQGGLEDMENGGFIADAADYQGTTSGVVGDLDDDGSVSSQDLLLFLAVYGNIYVGDNGAFTTAYVQINRSASENYQSVYETGTNIVYLDWADSDVDDVDPASIGINTYGSDETPANTIEFVSGSNAQYPITAWTQKRISLGPAGFSPSDSVIDFADSEGGLGREIILNIKCFDADDQEVLNEEEVCTLWINAAPGGDVEPGFSQLFGTPSYLSSTDLSSSSYHKIQVRIGVRAITAEDALFYAKLRRIKVSMRSA